MEIFKQYQPRAFGKAWANDPDYVVMARELEAMVQRFGIEGGDEGDAGAVAEDKEKKKKKKKEAKKYAKDY